MKRVLFFISLFWLVGFTEPGSIYNFSIVTPDGNELSLNSFEGKKLMIVILPSTTTPEDTAMLLQLNSLNETYKDSVTMIGVPSYEDGFTDDDASYLLDFYQTMLGESFVITGGMHTRKVEGQAELFSYLTNAELNGHFDEDVTGVGQKFFINSTGMLTGISVAGAAFNEDIFQNMTNN